MLHASVLMRTFTHLATLNFSGFCKIPHTVFKIPKLLSIVIRNCDKKQLYTSCVCCVEPDDEGVNIKSSSGYALSPEVDKRHILYSRFMQDHTSYKVRERIACISIGHITGVICHYIICRARTAQRCIHESAVCIA